MEEQQSGSSLPVPMHLEQQRDARARQAAGTLLLQSGHAAILGHDGQPDLQGVVEVALLEREICPNGNELLKLQLPDGSTAELTVVLSCPAATPRSNDSCSPPRSAAGGQDSDMLKPIGSPTGSVPRVSFGSKQSAASAVSRGSKSEDVLINTKFIKAESQTEEVEDSLLRMKVRGVLESKACEACIATVVLLNFGFTIVETDASAAGKETAPWLYHSMMVCFVSVIVEFCVRVYVERKTLFESPWAWLDMFIIFSGFLDYVIQMTGWGGVAVLRTLRIFRLLRLVRVVLHLRFFHELTKLLQMMGSCFRTLFWSFLLMGFVMTIWGTVAVEVIHPYVIELIDIHGEFADCPRCRTAFSSVLDADLTLFQTIIAGDSWGKLALPVIAYKPWTGIIFLGSLLTLVFGVLNLIVAVVVDTSAEVRAKDIIGRGFKLEYEEIEEKKALTKMFNKIDTDRNGSLSYDELTEGARKVTEFRHWLRVLDIDSDDLKQFFQLIDEDDSGEIEPHEFIEQMYRFKNTESKTAARFAKHLLAKLERQQVGFEEKVEATFETVKSKVDSCESALTTGFSNVKEGVTEQVPTRGLGPDEELHQRLSQQLDSMESAFQQATREALEIALRAAADTTRHLLVAANAASEEAPRTAAKPPKAAEDAQMDAAEEALAKGKGPWPEPWWKEILSPGSLALLPSENSKAECPPTAASRSTDAGDEDEPAGGRHLAPEEEPTEVGEEPDACGALEAPCQELRGPNGASAGPPKPLLPGGFQSRAPRPVLSPCDDSGAWPRSDLGVGLGPDLEKGRDAGSNTGAGANTGPRVGASRRPASRAGRRPEPPSSGA